MRHACRLRLSVELDSRAVGADRFARAPIRPHTSSHLLNWGTANDVTYDDSHIPKLQVDDANVPSTISALRD